MVGGRQIADPIVQTPAIALHRLLSELPLSAVTHHVLATALIIVFFITSSDSGSLVDDMVDTRSSPPILHSNS